MGNKLSLSGCIFPPTVSCNVERMKKENTGKKKQHIKASSLSLQRRKIKCCKSCFTWTVAILNAPLHHHDRHCKAYIASKCWKTGHITLDKKVLNTSTKHTFPSPCQETSRISYPTEHRKGQKEIGPEVQLEAIQQHRHKIHAKGRNKNDEKQTTDLYTTSPITKWPTYLHMPKVHWEDKTKRRARDTHTYDVVQEGEKAQAWA